MSQQVNYQVQRAAIEIRHKLHVTCIHLIKLVDFHIKLQVLNLLKDFIRSGDQTTYPPKWTWLNIIYNLH